MFLIGICGLKNSGKSTAAELIKTIYQDRYKVHLFAFADPMKHGLVATFGLDPADVWGDSWRREAQIHDVLLKNGKPFTIRYALQTYGDKIGRETWNRDVWIKTVMHQVNQVALHEAKNAEPIVVVSDVRRINEAKAIRDRGGIIIRLHRGKRSTFAKLADYFPFLYSFSSVHSSEREVHAPMMTRFVTDELRNDTGKQEDLREELRGIIFDRKIQASQGRSFTRRWVN